MLRVVSLLSIAPVYAQDARTHGEVQVVDGDAMHVVHVEWARDEAGVVPRLLIVGNRSDAVEVTVSFRCTFGDRLVTWETEAVRVNADESTSVDIDIPEDAYWSDAQANFLSDLESSVRSRDLDGNLVGTHSGPRLKLLWVDEESEFRMLDSAEAAKLAPHGYAGEAPPGAAEILIEEASPNVEFGPGI